MSEDMAGDRVKEFSDIIVEELKGLASEGKKLNAEFLATKLSTRPDIDQWIASQKEGNTYETSHTPGTAADMEKLKAQLEQSQLQRDRLLKQLADLDDSDSGSKNIYRQAMLVFADLLRTEENKRLHKPLDAIKRLLKDGADKTELEHLVQQIKDITLKEGASKEPKQSNLLNRFLSRNAKESDPGGSVLDQLKHAYNDIIGEFKLKLDETAFMRFKKVEMKVQNVEQVGDFSNIRSEILSYLQEYVSRIHGEREEAAAFIREIGKRLIEVESHILHSVPFAKQANQANNEFNSMLEKKIGELRKDIDFSDNLAELKKSVIASLSTIQKAIKKKREKDQALMSQMNEKMEILEKDLNEMKSKITHANDRAESLEKEALMDPLTGVYNRRAYDRRIREELQRFLRHKHPFSVLILDVDHFKGINDQYGHAVGDLCLKEIIKRVKPLLRESDFLARFGGEEFITLLPETKQEGAIEVAEKLRKSIEKTEFLHRGDAVEITISIGVTEVQATDEKPELIFTRVDKALYQAKEDGRNRVVAQ